MLHGKACSTGTLKLSETQGPEEMCLSLEHQNPSEKPLKKWGISDRVTVSLHIL